MLTLWFKPSGAWYQFVYSISNCSWQRWCSPLAWLPHIAGRLSAAENTIGTCFSEQALW